MVISDHHLLYIVVFLLYTMTFRYRKKLFTGFAVLLIFLLINFVLALLTNVNFIDIGLPNSVENTVI